MQRVEAEIAVSVSDLKKNPTAIVDNARGNSEAVPNATYGLGDLATRRERLRAAGLPTYPTSSAALR